MDIILLLFVLVLVVGSLLLIITVQQRRVGSGIGEQWREFEQRRRNREARRLARREDELDVMHRQLVWQQVDALYAEFLDRTGHADEEQKGSVR